MRQGADNTPAVVTFAATVASGRHTMSELTDQLACLTRLRDIDALDAALCQLAQQRLDCRQVAIHRLVSDNGARRWPTTARAGDLALREAPGPVEIGAEALDSSVRELPLLDARPVWRDCLQGETPLHLRGAKPGAPHTTLHPMATDTGSLGVMELRSAAPPDTDALRLTVSLLGFHRHLLGLMDKNERDSLTGPVQPQDLRRSLPAGGQGHGARKHGRC